MTKLNFIPRSILRIGTGDGAGATGAGAAGQGNPNPTGQGNPTGTPPPAGTFTQEQVNGLVAAEKRKMQARLQQFEEMQTRLNLTEQEKAQVAEQLEAMRGELQTKEEQTQQQLAKLQKKYDTDTAASKQETTTWRGRFETKLKDVEIVSAASKANAFNADQVKAILAPLTTVREEIGGDGKPTGNFVAQVKFQGRDKDKKPIELTLSVEDAVKAMTEMPDVYGNLFKGSSTSGTGTMPASGGNQGSGEIPDLNNMSATDYAKYRAQVRAQLTKR